MATLIAATNRFIEISLDAVDDFDITADLVGMGLNRNPENGIRVRKITFVPSAVGDGVVVRDGQNGPRIFTAENVLGTYDILKDEYLSDDGKSGKLMSPYIAAAESTIGVANQAYLIFEL